MLKEDEKTLINLSMKEFEERVKEIFKNETKEKRLYYIYSNFIKLNQKELLKDSFGILDCEPINEYQFKNYINHLVIKHNKNLKLDSIHEYFYYTEDCQDVLDYYAFRDFTVTFKINKYSCIRYEFKIRYYEA